jgi:ABC-type lipoprotein export system ATPase subunit
LLPTEPDRAVPILSLASVGRWFWRGSVRVEVLRGVALEIGVGELVAVWGRLGSGKTTLLRLQLGGGHRRKWDICDASGH